MHYKNGREAKLGDPVIRRNYAQQIEVGVVVQLSPGTSSCNCSVAQFSGRCHGSFSNLTGFATVDAEGNVETPYVSSCQNVVEFLHAEDAIKAFEKLEKQMVS